MGKRNFFSSTVTVNDAPKKRDKPRSSSSTPVSELELGYWKAVAMANQIAADQVKAGTSQLPPKYQSFFVHNAGQPVNPTNALGYTWFADHGVGQMQLVDHETLVAMGMDRPEDMPGMQQLFGGSKTSTAS